MTETEDHASLTAQLLVDGEPVTISGRGNGPIDALVVACATGSGSRSTWSTTTSTPSAREPTRPRWPTWRRSTTPGVTRWGIGTHPNIVTASLRAVLSAAERVRRGDQGR